MRRRVQNRRRTMYVKKKDTENNLMDQDSIGSQQGDCPDIDNKSEIMYSRKRYSPSKEQKKPLIDSIEPRSLMKFKTPNNFPDPFENFWNDYQSYGKRYISDITTLNNSLDYINKYLRCNESNERKIVEDSI